MSSHNGSPQPIADSQVDAFHFETVESFWLIGLGSSGFFHIYLPVA
jgi:hypothetical protein